MNVMCLKCKFEDFNFSTLFLGKNLDLVCTFAAMWKSVSSQGKGHVVKTCVTFKSMEMTLLVGVVFFVRVF